MKRLITIVTVFFMTTTTMYGQTDSISVEAFQTEFEVLKSRADELRKSAVTLKPSSEYQEEIKTLSQKSLELSIEGSENKQAIQAIKDQIRQIEPLLDKSIEREKMINELNAQMAKLNQELLEFKNFKQLTEAEEQQTAELLEKAKEANQALIREAVSNLIGNAEVFSSMSSSLAYLSKIAKGVLIFDEKTSNKLWDGIKKGGLDLLTIAAGGFAVSKFNDGNNTEAYTAIGVGLGFKVLQSQIKDNKTVERITRNIAFSDEIRAYASITGPLDSTVSQLSKDLPMSPIEKSEWFPSRKNLNQYRKIIDYMKEIQFQNLMIKNKAVYLLELGKTGKTLSSEGETLLNEVVEHYHKAASDWNKFEPVYLERYQILLAELQRRETEQVILKKV